MDFVVFLILIFIGIILVSMETNIKTHTAPRQNMPAQSSPSLDVHLGYWLRLVSNHVSGSFARALQTQSLSVAEWVALNQIQQWADLTPAKLADVMGVTRGAVSKILDKLQAKNWISRVTSAGDSRVRCLSLTPQGQQVLPGLAVIADKNDEYFFGVLGLEEQIILRSLLSRLAAAHQINNIPVD